jgi:exosome complex RNA-binding protein Rrp42 (RNase PH superfamily)
VSGSGDEAEVRVLPTEEAEPQPLVFHHMPIAATLGFFRAAEGGGAPITVLDPGDREELVRHRGVVVAVAVAVAVPVVCRLWRWRWWCGDGGVAVVVAAEEGCCYCRGS